MDDETRLTVYRLVTALGWPAYRRIVAAQVADGILTAAEGIEALAYAKRVRP